MSPWQLLAPAFLTGVIAIAINWLDRSRHSGRVDGRIEAGLAALATELRLHRADSKRAIDEMRADINRRFDDIEKSQTRQWLRLDEHTREIYRLQGRVDSLACDGKKPSTDCPKY